jgi:hypothetical protein
LPPDDFSEVARSDPKLENGRMIPLDLRDADLIRIFDERSREEFNELAHGDQAFFRRDLTVSES